MTFPLQEAMWSYNKTQISPYDPAKLAIQSILGPESDLISYCGQNFKNTVSFDDIVLFIVEENIVTNEILIVVTHCTLKLLQKADTSNEIGNTFPDPVKNPNGFPVTFNITVLLMSSITLISFWTRTFYWTWFQWLLSHSTTLRIDILFPISTLNQQLTNLEQTYIRCSLHCERWTLSGRDRASTLHSFNEITYQTDEWTKQLLRLKSWMISGNPEHWIKFRRLWWSVMAFKCG